MKSVPLTPDESLALVQPFVTVTKQEAAQILREVTEADKGDDWEDYASW